MAVLQDSPPTQLEGDAGAAPPPPTSAADFSQPGPWACTTWRAAFSVPPELRGAIAARLGVTVTLPDVGTALPPPPPPASPFGPGACLLLFNGFQARAAWYRRWAEQAAGWGLVVVQYDLPPLRMATIAAEMRLFQPLVAWLEERAADPACPLHGRVDCERLLLAGHSRGGKLAALLFADNPGGRVRAAYLLDAVDETKFAPESPDFPSAAKALARCGRAVGITGAGVIGSCNPAGSGYRELFPAAAPGSWLEVLPGAAHAAFFDAGWLLNRVFDLVCACGSARRAEVERLAMTPLLAWFWRELRVGGRQGGGGSTAAAAGGGGGGGVSGGGGHEQAVAGVVAKEEPTPLDLFFAWVAREEADGRLTFQIKQQEQQQAAGAAATGGGGHAAREAAGSGMRVAPA